MPEVLRNMKRSWIWFCKITEVADIQKVDKGIHVEEVFVRFYRVVRVRDIDVAVRDFVGEVALVGTGVGDIGTRV